jgi:hypothetical protein
VLGILDFLFRDASATATLAKLSQIQDIIYLMNISCEKSIINAKGGKYD